ncbi:MAG: hypothetical protein Q9227_009531 [Pyrenula ochraceoflavens]
MSLEAALDQERREVMDILEGKSNQPASPSAKRDRNASPTPAIRSVGITSPPPRTSVRSLLDPKSPPPANSSHSATTSPTTPQSFSGNRQRSSSDAASVRTKITDKQGVDIDNDYQFEMLPSIANQAMPKRVGQAGRLGEFSSSAMAAAMSGDLNSLPTLNPSMGIRTSRSPSAKIGRSSSPGPNSLTSQSNVPSKKQGKYVTDSGKVIDMGKAYKRLSDAALLKSGGSLSEATRKSNSRGRGSSVDSASPGGDARLEKDDPQEYGDEDGSADSTEYEDEEATSEDEYQSEASRGRRRRRKKGSALVDADLSESDADKSGPETTLGLGRAKGEKKTAQSLLAAAEEETYAEPAISVTSPGGEKLTPKKSGVHPHTSFDHTASGVESALSSDNDADISEIKRAQKLSISLSPIDSSVPTRAIRTILRGDFAEMQQESQEGSRRQRLYLVATDLSDEAKYALEWTIGTILRDGDTLFAIYAAEDESGAIKGDESNMAAQLGEGATAVEDAVSTLESLTQRAQANPISANAPVSLRPGTAPGSRAGSRDTRGVSKLEAERTRAIEEITTTCLKLLRKTRLEVRVAVEVIHCKSPKHMITEAIDGLEPTLVVLGSRGRSALKGVLLGSFSNYLVTKSSVPVMVARKKLRKHAKFKNTNIRLSNNLTNSKRLVTAKID